MQCKPAVLARMGSRRINDQCVRRLRVRLGSQKWRGAEDQSPVCSL